jgi:predicted MFS family arabinose efflux permease
MWRLPLLSLSALAAVAAGFVWAFFPRFTNGPPTNESYAPPARRQAGILLQRGFQTHLLLTVCVFAAMFAAYTYLAAWLHQIVGLENRGVAVALAGFGLAGLIGNAVVARLADRSVIGMTVLVVFMVAAAAVGLSVTYEHMLIMALLLALWGAAHTAGVTLCQVRVTLAGGSTAAFAMAMNISAANLGIALGALAGGIVVERAGVNAIGWGAAILFSGVLVTAAAAYWVNRLRRESDGHDVRRSGRDRKDRTLDDRRSAQSGCARAGGRT